MIRREGMILSFQDSCRMTATKRTLPARLVVVGTTVTILNPSFPRFHPSTTALGTAMQLILFQTMDSFPTTTTTMVIMKRGMSLLVPLSAATTSPRTSPNNKSPPCHPATISPISPLLIIMAVVGNCKTFLWRSPNRCYLGTKQQLLMMRMKGNGFDLQRTKTIQSLEALPAIIRNLQQKTICLIMMMMLFGTVYQLQKMTFKTLRRVQTERETLLGTKRCRP
mmetsp:Transcript_24524/g.60135  ORF Transcript_24524/g.60135 Transcript_24524/m.60135 type:complete len:223 (+) Transcript_24524:1560-2228(+)